MAEKYNEKEKNIKNKTDIERCLMGDDIYDFDDKLKGFCRL